MGGGGNRQTDRQANEIDGRMNRQTVRQTQRNSAAMEERLFQSLG